MCATCVMPWHKGALKSYFSVVVIFIMCLFKRYSHKYVKRFICFSYDTALATCSYLKPFEKPSALTLMTQKLCEALTTYLQRYENCSLIVQVTLKLSSDPIWLPYWNNVPFQVSAQNIAPPPSKINKAGN